MNDYCRTCEEEVARCWDSGSGCSGGGHCWSCGGYNFADLDNESEEQIEMREADKVLTKTLAE